MFRQVLSHLRAADRAAPINDGVAGAIGGTEQIPVAEEDTGVILGLVGNCRRGGCPRQLL